MVINRSTRFSTRRRSKLMNSSPHSKKRRPCMRRTSPRSKRSSLVYSSTSLRPWLDRVNSQLLEMSERWRQIWISKRGSLRILRALPPNFKLKSTHVLVISKRSKIWRTVLTTNYSKSLRELKRWKMKFQTNSPRLMSSRATSKRKKPAWLSLGRWLVNTKTASRNK
jgi:hypothetical protein